MKKVFIVSLLLISIFLISNAELASAQCQDYECTLFESAYGEFYDSSDTCVELCPGDPYMLYGVWFTGYLYPATDSKYLLGTAFTSSDWAGCSVEHRGRSITAKLSYIQHGYGYVDILRCTPCNDCCNNRK